MSDDLIAVIALPVFFAVFIGAALLRLPAWLGVLTAIVAWGGVTFILQERRRRSRLRK